MDKTKPLNDCGTSRSWNRKPRWQDIEPCGLRGVQSLREMASVSAISSKSHEGQRKHILNMPELYKALELVIKNYEISGETTPHIPVSF